MLYFCSQNGVKGVIKINGDDRDMRIFKKLNCYIMHDDILQPRLTTLESMRIAAELKLGAEIKKANKEVIVSITICLKSCFIYFFLRYTY